MTTIETTATDLIVHVRGIDRLFAFKSELRVPLVHVSRAERAEDEARDWWHGFRAPGTNLPGVVTAGTFHESDGRVFWDVHDPSKAIAILLHDEKYAKLVIEVEDPDAALAQISAAVAAAQPPSA